MPLLFRFLSFRFSFRSKDHLPPHVHVVSGGKATIFDLIITDGVLVDIKMRSADGYKDLDKKDQNVVMSFIRIYYAQIVEKWVDYYLLNKKIKTETIQKVGNVVVDAKQLTDDLNALNKHFYQTEKKQPVAKPKKK